MNRLTTKIMPKIKSWCVVKYELSYDFIYVALPEFDVGLRIIHPNNVATFTSINLIEEVTKKKIKQTLKRD